MTAFKTASALASSFFLAALVASGSAFGQAAPLSVPPGATASAVSPGSAVASAVSPGSTAASAVAPGRAAPPIRPAAPARRSAPAKATAGSLSGATTASEAADCASKRRAYLESQACFERYRLANGAIRTEANGRCRPVVDPSPQCGQNFPAK